MGYSARKEKKKVSGSVKPKCLKWPPTGVLGKPTPSPLKLQGEENGSRLFSRSWQGWNLPF